MTTLRRAITRREFLKMTGTGVAAASMSTLLSACGGGGQTLRFWWWGEQEAPGLEGWINETVQLFQEENGSIIETHLQDTTTVISEFQTAAAAGEAPDLQFLWNGIYHMESVWLGYLQPLDGLIPAAEIAATNPTVLSRFEGQNYRMGWYSAAPLYVYNKEMFSRAGLNADTPPATWDELLEACDRLKTAGLTPIVGGLKDGPWGEWYMGHGLGQNLDSPADALNLFIGNLDWREPRYHEHWTRLKELWDAGFINDDINSIDLYPGIDLFGTGNGAMTAIVAPILNSQADMLGREKVGLMTFPVFGVGQMAGKPISDGQGIGISAGTQFAETAAEFLRFIHQPERVQALWEQTKAVPMDADFDVNLIDDPLLRQLRTEWVAGDTVPYISNLMPVLFWTDAMFVNSQKIITGEFDGEQAGQNAYDVTQRWLEQNPDLVEKYSTWAADLTL